MTLIHITADLLRQHLACECEVLRFEKLWPNGVQVTLKNCQRAACHDFDLDWAAAALLSTRAGEAYAAASLAARKVYDKAIPPARRAYRDDPVASSWEAFEEASLAAWKIYDETVALAEKVYAETTARAFWEAAEQHDKDAADV